MNSGRTIFAQLMSFLPAYEFRQCVKRYNGNYKIKSFSCWDQFLCMASAQLTYRESLRDIQACLRAAKQKMYHMGIRGKVSRNTLAHANQVRDWRIYADFAQVLIKRARELYINESFGMELDQSVYALDSTVIDLCLSLFPWAEFRKRKGAIKLHTLLDLHGSIPTMVFITHGKVQEVNILDEIPIEAGAVYIMDRGYLDFARLYRVHRSAAFFVTRAKSNFRFQRLYSHAVDKSTGLQCDQTITLHGYYAKKDYPERLRRIRFYDAEQGKRLVFQQLQSFGTNDHRALSEALANRAVLQMDQTAPQDQGLLRHLRECREDSDLDRNLHIRACGDHQKTTQTGAEPLLGPTDSEHHPFRENAAVAGSYSCGYQRTECQF